MVAGPPAASNPVHAARRVKTLAVTVQGIQPPRPSTPTPTSSMELQATALGPAHGHVLRRHPRGGNPKHCHPCRHHSRHTRAREQHAHVEVRHSAAAGRRDAREESRRPHGASARATLADWRGADCGRRGRRHGGAMGPAWARHGLAAPPRRREACDDASDAVQHDAPPPRARSATRRRRAAAPQPTRRRWTTGSVRVPQELPKDLRISVE